MYLVRGPTCAARPARPDLRGPTLIRSITAGHSDILIDATHYLAGATLTL
jgi:hypothetical protein